jgi:hypothetical protein
MILLNFSHPLTEAQRAAIEALAGAPIDRGIDLPVQFDHDRPFAGQAGALADAAGLSPREWQTAPLLIVPPSLSSIAAVLLAELHGRMGYFPPVVRLRPAEGALPPRYEVAEIVNLQAVRDAARARRR